MSEQPRVWICWVDDPDPMGRRIRAWTSDPKRAEQFRAEGLDMVEYVPAASVLGREQS